MRLRDDEFGAAAYIFEQVNGNIKTDVELQIIEKSGFKTIHPDVLEKKIIEGINNGSYQGSKDRVSAYWVLGKRYNKTLIPEFNKWLKIETINGEVEAVYQILIALSNMGLPIFNTDREGCTASWEHDLNLRDAKAYLKSVEENK